MWTTQVNHCDYSSKGVEVAWHTPHSFMCSYDHASCLCPLLPYQTSKSKATLSDRTLNVEKA